MTRPNQLLVERETGRGEERGQVDSSRRIDEEEEWCGEVIFRRCHGNPSIHRTEKWCWESCRGSYPHWMPCVLAITGKSGTSEISRVNWVLTFFVNVKGVGIMKLLHFYECGKVYWQSAKEADECYERYLVASCRRF